MAKQKQQLSEMQQLLQERIEELELALEDINYIRLLAASEQEFSREGLFRITRLGRVMAIKNPLIKRGIQVHQIYTWGQGISVTTNQEEVTELLMQFWDNYENRKELTSLRALVDKQKVLHTDGNIFVVLVVNAVKGTVTIRNLPFSDIDDVITDPNDKKAVWYYVRKKVNASDRTPAKVYPNWSYLLKGPANLAKLPALPDDAKKRLGTHEIVKDQFVYHIRKGGFADWKYAVPTVYAAIDWAKAYKEFLEDWLSIVRAYRKYAWKVTTPDSRTQQKTRDAMANVASQPPAVGVNQLPPSMPFMPGATAVTREGNDIEPMRTSGATIGIDDGRRVLLMVCAAFGLPETYFGDVSVGTLATADSLDRPTELMFKLEQSDWISRLSDIFMAVIAVAYYSQALGGALKSILQIDTEGNFVWNVDPQFHLEITFPPIVVGTKTEEVSAITSAASYLGDPRTVQRMLLVALGEDDVDEMLESLPEVVNDIPAFRPPPDPTSLGQPCTGNAATPPRGKAGSASSSTRETLRHVLSQLVQKLANGTE